MAVGPGDPGFAGGMANPFRNKRGLYEVTQPLHGSIGGSKNFTVYSGTAGGGQVIWSGPGRLNTVTLYRRIQSGLNNDIVDFGGTFVSGLTGFAGASSMPFIGQSPATYEGATMPSGTYIGNAYETAFPVRFDIPFFSGLATSTTSGINAFTITYTPEKPLD